MKLVIDTAGVQQELVDALVEQLRAGGWQYQFNNHVTVDTPDEPIVECHHHYINGVCTKCQWLEI